MDIRKNFIALNLCFLILCLATKSATSNRAGNTQVSVSSNPYVGTQPPNFKLLCMWFQQFSLPIKNGNLTVHCLLNKVSIRAMVVTIRGYGLLTNQAVGGVTSKANFLFDRDSFASVCLLDCVRGQPYPRFRYLPSLVEEPTRVNIGCDDMSNMRCEGTCDEDIFTIPNGQVECTEGNFHSSTCRVRCRTGYAPRGPTTKICVSSASTWVPRTPFRCEKICSNSVYDVFDGNVTCNDSIFAGSVCTLRCWVGYKTSGTNVRKCVASGSSVSWQPSSPFRCEGIRCPALPTVLNGRIQCTDGNRLLSRCVLSCDVGYEPTTHVEQLCIPDTNSPSNSWIRINSDGKALTNSFNQFNCKAVVRSTETPSASLPYEAGQFNGSIAILKRLNYCAVPQNEQRPCGNNRVTRRACIDNRCCWNESAAHTSHRCFNPSVTPVLGLTKIPPTRAYENPRTPRPITTPSAPRRITPYIRQLPPLLYIPASLSNLRFAGRKIQCGCKSQIRSKTCALSQNSNAVIAPKVTCGISTSAANWPWQALVSYNGMLCGGTLIEPQFVVTAAHCVLPADGSLDGGPNYVGLGVTDTNNTNDPNVQVRKIIRVMRHPNFTEVPLVNYYINDIAVLKLDSPAKVTGSAVRPLCLPEGRIPMQTDECYVTGFGKTSPSSKHATILQAAKVPLVNTITCLGYYRGLVRPGQHICAGAISSSRSRTADTCRGDSGGPLACRRKGTTECGWYLAGITSFGRAPCGQGIPSVYVNVYRYQEWIYRSTVMMGSYSTFHRRIY